MIADIHLFLSGSPFVLSLLLCSFCLRSQLAVVVVGFPATPLLLARVRFCLSAGHTRAQLEYALMQIEDVADTMGCKYAVAQV